MSADDYKQQQGPGGRAICAKLPLPSYACLARWLPQHGLKATLALHILLALPAA